MADARVQVRRRADGHVELRVNGVFVMDDAETGSERALAAAAGPARDVLIGGLGLGFTLRAVLAAGHARRVVVAEREPELVALVRHGDLPGADLLADPRVQVEVADVQSVVTAQPAASLDAILLDVDNGPDHLVHTDNAAVYGAGFLRTCAARLRPGGVVAVWSQADSPTLRAALAAAVGPARTTEFPVVLQGRATAYWILTATVG